MENKYYIVLISTPKGSNDNPTNWYYLGWKSTWEMGSIRDFYPSFVTDVKLYQNPKVAERIAKKIVAEHEKAYSWMNFSYEIKKCAD